MLSFAKNNHTMIVDVVRERNVTDAICKMKNAALHGARGFDLHLSTLEEPYRNTESIRAIINSVNLPTMALNYSTRYDGSSIEETEDERVALIKMAIDAGVSCIDMQAYTFNRECKQTFDAQKATPDMIFAHMNPKEVCLDEGALAKQKELVDYAHERGCEVLISCHTGEFLNADEMVCLAKLLKSRGADVLKFVGDHCDTDEQLAENFRGMLALKRELGMNIHYHNNGAKGKITRIMNPMLGAYLVFCSDGYNRSSHMAQMELSNMVNMLSEFEKAML